MKIQKQVERERKQEHRKKRLNHQHKASKNFVGDGMWITGCKIGIIELEELSFGGNEV